MTPDTSPDWTEIDPSDERWIREQVGIVLDSALSQLREQLPPCEVADVMRRFGPRILDHIELEVRRRASRLANAMREAEATHETRH